MKTSKSENAEMIVLHGAKESTVYSSCPVDEEIGVESSSGMSKITRLVGYRAWAKYWSLAPRNPMSFLV